MDSGATLGVTALVGHTFTDACQWSSSHQETEECPHAPLISRSTPNYETHQIDGLSALQKQLWERGVSEEGMDSIMVSWKPGTNSTNLTSTDGHKFLVEASIPLIPLKLTLLTFVWDFSWRGSQGVFSLPLHCGGGLQKRQQSTHKPVSAKVFLTEEQLNPATWKPGT